MSKQQVSQWRTVGLVVFGVIVLTFAFLSLVVRALPAAGTATSDAALITDQVVRLFGLLADAVVWLVAAVAFKASIEHLGRMGGVGGAVKALMAPTPPEPEPAKPADPAPPAAPPAPPVAP